jgi:hypothetical protein
MHPAAFTHLQHESTAWPQFTERARILHPAAMRNMSPQKQQQLCSARADGRLYQAEPNEANRCISKIGLVKEHRFRSLSADSRKAKQAATLPSIASIICRSSFMFLSRHWEVSKT